MVAWLDVCRYSPTAGGTADFTYAAAITGYQSPTAAGAVNGAIYRYRAESNDLTQWEVGYGAYNTATGVLSRTTVLFNSSATGTGAGQSGAGSKINFTITPQVAVVALAEDLLILGSGTFTQFEYTATAGQTTFSGSDINGATLAYTVGYLEVYLNGGRLNKADFTATTGTSVVFPVALAASDQVTLTAYTTATVANTVAKTGDTMSGALTISAVGSTTTVGPLNLTAVNAGIEIGAVGVSNTPFIDFHSSANVNDYDVRLIASSGAAGVGLGILSVTAASSQFSGEVSWTGSAWTAYTPTVTIPSGAGTATGRYKTIGKTLAITVTVTVTTGGASCTLSLPAGFTSAGVIQYLAGREGLVNGFMYNGVVGPSVTAIGLNRYDNVGSVIAGLAITLSGTIEIV